MKKQYAPLIPFLVALIPQLILLGWPTMPTELQLVFRLLSGLAFIGLIVLCLIIFWDRLASLIPIRIRFENRGKSKLNKTILKSLLDDKGTQEKHEEQWLRPVIEWMDFNRQGLPANQIVIKYQIDSGLLYEFKPHRIWVKPVIDQWEPKDGIEVIPTRNLLPLKRSQWSSEIITITDSGLLAKIDSCRKGAQMRQTLKIIMELRDGEEPKTLEPTYSITPW